MCAICRIQANNNNIIAAASSLFDYYYNYNYQFELVIFTYEEHIFYFLTQ